MNVVDSGSDLSKFKREQVEKVGQIAVEGMLDNPKYKALCEKLKISKEDLTNSTPLYTSVMAAFIEKKMRPDLVAAGLIKTISNFSTKGQNAMIVPLRDALITASDLGQTGALTNDTGSYGTTTITLTYKYASNQMTHEILKFANADLIAEEMGEIGDALGRKIDSDIIAALKVATASTNTNSNYHNTGSATTITYDHLVDGTQSAKALYAKPEVLLLNPTMLGRILKLDEFSGGTSITGSLVFKGDDGTNFPIPKSVLGLRVIESTQVDKDDVYFVDTKRTGYLVKAGDIETFDGRVSNYLAFEIIGALNYGVTIVQPKSVYRIAQLEGA